jgi:imidazolonepropionase-like amidohydrolase
VYPRAIDEERGVTRTLFAGGAVFDGTGAPLADADVVVEDGVIVEVGPGLDGDERIDCAGRAVLPGLFDCHTHVMVSHIDYMRHLQTPFSYRFFQAAKNLEATLRVGITSIRDAGGADLGIKQAVQDGLIAGPRMQITVRMISQTGGHADGWLPSGRSLSLFMEYPGMPAAIVDNPDEMRKKVRELIRAGADVIKVAVTGGVLSWRDDPRHAHFRMDELRVMVAEASSAGRWVMAHAGGSLGVKQAVLAGVRSIEHGIFLDDEAISLILEHDAYLVPTLIAPTGVLQAAEAGAAIPETSLLKAKEICEIHRNSFRRAVEAGVKVAMGTDTGVTPHGDNLKELALMAEGGMSKEDVLVATTSRAADLLGVGEELGTIEPGKRADLVLVDGDPFDFGTLDQRIDAVYQDGALVVG